MAPTQTDARTLLVVEDYEDSLAFLTALLTREGYNILTAGTGEEAIRMVVGRRPDLILMDLGLPGINGLEVVWHIREQPELAEVPIIIISAHDSYDLREEATKAGCKGYLTKPLDLAEFKQLIKSILNEGKASHNNRGPAQ
jgi:CheY-like chemotaxis protein